LAHGGAFLETQLFEMPDLCLPLVSPDSWWVEKKTQKEILPVLYLGFPKPEEQSIRKISNPRLHLSHLHKEWGVH